LDRVDFSRLTDVRRGTEAYELLRLRTERHEALTGKIPRVMLAEFGDVKMRSARSNFAANFFACAGFDIATQRFDSADEIAACDADLIVLCSSDAEYLALATELMPKLNARGRSTPVLVAGNPETTEQLKAAGIADFVHVRSNPIELLAKWQNNLGVKD
jgi:methylmalonyl-CoA mutase